MVPRRDHAELAFRIFSWLGSQLDADERRAVSDAAAEAIASLRAAAACGETANDLTTVAGVAAPRERAALLALLEHHVFTTLLS